MMRIVASWSGGKESCLACHKAISDGLEVSFLLNMVSEDGSRSRSHGLPAALIAAQSQAIGIPLVQRRTTWDSYELEFKDAIHELKDFKVEGGVFGDIYVQEHKDWVNRVCRELGIEAIMPLWGRAPMDILCEFIDLGFKAVVVRTRADLLGKKWLGREIDASFVGELSKMSKVDLCGELGEYHTFVVDGPLFKHSIKIVESAKTLKDGCWSLDILKWE
jgi:diphthine-ammonia ligase